MSLTVPSIKSAFRTRPDVPADQKISADDANLWTAAIVAMDVGGSSARARVAGEIFTGEVGLKSDAALVIVKNSTDGRVGGLGTVNAWVGSGGNVVDLAIGSSTGGIKLYTNNSSTAALTISTANAVEIPGTLGVTGAATLGTTTITGGNDNSLIVDNGGQQFTSIYLKSGGTYKAQVLWDQTNAIMRLGPSSTGTLSLWANGAERATVTSLGLYEAGSRVWTAATLPLAFTGGRYTAAYGAGDATLRIDSPAASNAYLELSKAGAGKWQIVSLSSSNDLQFYAVGTGEVARLTPTSFTVTGSAGVSGGDSLAAFRSYNTAASSATQFYVNHVGSVVEAGNSRGDLRLGASGINIVTVTSTGLNVVGALTAFNGASNPEAARFAGSNGTRILLMGNNILGSGGGAHPNWMIGVQDHVNGGLEITPSTANGGLTFTTPIVTVTSTGLSVTGVTYTQGTNTADQDLFIAGSGYGSHPAIFRVRQVASDAVMELATAGGTTFLTANSTGLGIGGTPSYPLQVWSMVDGAIANIRRVGNTNNPGLWIHVTESTSTVKLAASSSTSAGMQIGADGGREIAMIVGVTEIARFNSTGVGIGLAPSRALDVSGAIGGNYYVQSVAGTSSVYALECYNGNGRVGSITTSGSATAFNTSSDERLKEHFAPADDVGAIIDATPVEAFDWRAGGHVRVGFVAQHLHNTVPEAVTVGGDDPRMNPWAIDRSALVPYLWRDAQQTHASLAALASRVAALEGARN